jgi:hypothetical protein
MTYPQAEAIHHSHSTMDDPTRAVEKHSRFAGRFPAGTAQAVALKKNGIRHVSIS